MVKKLFMSLLLVASSSAMADNCELTIEGNDAMQYNTKELSVPASCKDVKLTIKHVGKLPKAAMGHNWILVKDADFASVSVEAMKVGPAAEYSPKGNKAVIALTKLVGGGEEDTTTFSTKDLKAGEAYVYFCSFPGHSSLMKGTFTIK